MAALAGKANMTTPARIDPRISLALRESRGRFVSPADLAVQAGLAPRGVRAALDGLAAGGFQLESHPLQGIRLASPPPSLREEELTWGRTAARVGRNVRCVESAPSTSDLAWRAAGTDGPDADGLAVFAEYQTAGRGRRGARWFAPPHEAVLCSILLLPAGPLAEGGVLTRSAAVAAAEALETLSSAEVGIKWPNDLVLEDRKVGGILVETRAVPGRSRASGTGAAVVGIGINCHQGPEAFPPAIRPDVTSPAMLGIDLDRTLLARGILARLDEVLGRAVSAPKGSDGVRREAARRCRTLGRRITVRDGETEATGEVVDLDPDYGLVLRLPDGALRRFDPVRTRVLARGSRE